MPSRFFTDFSANASTFIGIPSYTGAITYKCYPRANNAGLPNSPAVILNQWNTFTTSVTALTEIGRGFNGVISDISGTGLNIPVALSTGIEAPATLSGAGFTQYECEELNGGDWVRLLNRFTAGSVIIESGTAAGFPPGLTLNNLTAGRQYYIDVKFEVVDAVGVVLDQAIPYNRYVYSLGGLSTIQHDSGKFSIGSAYYPPALTSGGHYVQILNTTTQRVKITSRVSEVMKQPKVAKNLLYILGNGQSLSIGATTTNSTAPFLAPVRNDSTHWTAGNSRPTSRGQGIASAYQHLRPWTESKNGQTHVHAMLKKLDSSLPDNWNTWTINEGTSGQTIDAMTLYASAHAGVALSQFTATTLPVASERAAAVIIHGEANSVDFATYATKLGVLHDNYIAEVLARRPSIAGTDMILDQTGGSFAYWNVAVKTWEYSKSRADVFLSGPKYHINHRFPAIPVTDTVHLNAQGYSLQGEYLAKALDSAAFGGRQWKPFQPKAAYSGGGNLVIIEFDVPIPPIIRDVTTVPQALGDGIGYKPSSGGTIVPSTQNVGTTTITIDIGQPAAIGDVIEFGNNNTSTFSIVNFRDSDNSMGQTSGISLPNWLVLSYIAVGEAPPPSGPIKPRDVPRLRVSGGQILTSSSGVLAAGIPVYIDPNGQFVNTPNGQPFLSGCTISGGNIVFEKTTIAPPAVIYRAPDRGVTTTPNGDPIAEFIA